MQNYPRFLHAKHFQSRDHAPKHDFVDFNLTRCMHGKIYGKYRCEHSTLKVGYMKIPNLGQNFESEMLNAGNFKYYL